MLVLCQHSDDVSRIGIGVLIRKHKYYGISVCCQDQSDGARLSDPDSDPDPDQDPSLKC